MLFVINDLGVWVRRIVDLMEQELGEDDAEDSA